MRKFIPIYGIGGYALQKKILSAIVAVLAVAVIAVAGFYFRGKGRNLAAALGTSFDLSASGSELPAGWYVTSYENEYAAYADGDGVVTLRSDVADDLRLCKKITVAEGTEYVLSGFIATENVQSGRGASLSIDNYNLEKSRVYSDSLSDRPMAKIAVNAWFVTDGKPALWEKTWRTKA